MTQQVFLTNSLGGVLSFNRLSKEIREQNMPEQIFRQFVSVKEGGSRKGDTVYFNKRLRIDTRGGTLSETSTIPSNLIKFVRGSVVVTEYGNGIEYTGKLESLSEWNVKDEFQQGLRQDIRDTLDLAVATIFQTAKFKAVCTSTAITAFTTNGTATITTTANPSDKNIRDIVDYLKLKHVPYYGGGKEYNGILSINGMRGVYDFLEQKMQYVTPISEYNNEKGRYYGVRMVEDLGVLSNALGGSTYGEGLLFGDEAIMEAVAIAEEIRMDTPADAGRDQKVVWYSILGFAKIWDLAADDLNSTGKGIERIVHITSA